MAIIFIILIFHAADSIPSCKYNEIKYKLPNDTIICEACSVCPPGKGLSHQCGDVKPIPYGQVSCTECTNNTYSVREDSAMCDICQPCDKDEEVETQSCSPTQNRICTCRNGLERSVAGECVGVPDKNCAPGQGQRCGTQTPSTTIQTPSATDESPSTSITDANTAKTDVTTAKTDATTAKTDVTTAKTDVTTAIIQTVVPVLAKPKAVGPSTAMSQLNITLICIAILLVLLVVLGIVLIVYKKPFRRETLRLANTEVRRETPRLGNTESEGEADQDYFSLSGNLRVNVEMAFDDVNDHVLSDTLRQFATVLELKTNKFKKFSKFSEALKTKYPVFGCHILVKLLKIADRNDVIQLLHVEFHESDT